MYSYKLTDVKNNVSITIDNTLTTPINYRTAPVNWNKMNYTFTRNEKYYGLFPTFTAQIGFRGDAKKWLDNIFWSQGMNAQIDVVISAYNSTSKKFEIFITGIVNMETFSIKQFTTDTDIIDTIFIRDVMNKDGIDLDYQKMIDSYSINHVNDINWVAPSFENIKITGLITADCTLGYVNSYAVYPFQLFKQLVGLMTGKQNFCSSYFGKTTDKDENGNYYSVNGQGAYMMITTGRYIRGYLYGELKQGSGTITVSHISKTVNGVSTHFLTELAPNVEVKDSEGQILGIVDTILSDNVLTLVNFGLFDYTNQPFQYINSNDGSILVLSFEKLFKSLSALFKLGMTIINNNRGIPFAQVELLENYFNNEVIAELDRPKNINISFDPTWRFNSIDIGYTKFQKNQNNPYGNTEYNNKSNYISPTLFIKKNLSIISDIRADGTAIQMCMDMQKTGGTDTHQNQLDTEIFIVSCEFKDGIVQSRNDDNINIVPGSIYGTNPKINLELSPARMLMKWSDMIRVGLDLDQTKSLIFHRQEQLSKLSTRIQGESMPVTDGANIPISSLFNPFLNGCEANFSSPFGIDEILNLKKNPFGLIKFVDIINHKFQYGWVKEASMEPIDKKTNWQTLLMSQYVTPIERQWKLKYLDGSYILFLDGSKMLLLNQN